MCADHHDYVDVDVDVDADDADVDESEVVHLLCFAVNVIHCKAHFWCRCLSQVTGCTKFKV